MIGHGLRFGRCTLLLAALFALSIGDVGAQGYPNRPVRLVVPVAPGGVIDFVGRSLAQQLSEGLGQPVVVENRPGAGGITGTDGVARSAPDGYTLVLMDMGVVVNPVLRPSLVTYDLFTQLQTVSIVSTSPLVVVVSPTMPVKSFPEFVAYGKTKPAKFNFASPGIGSTTHLATEIFKLRSGVAATHVAYRGVGSSFTDLMNDEIQFVFSSIAGALSLIESNRIRGIATTGRLRSSLFPDLPTVSEAGIPGFQVEIWLGLFAPAPLAPDVLARLNAEVKKALEKSEIKAGWHKVGILPLGTSPQDGSAFIRAEYEKWRKVIAEANLKDG